MTKYETAIALGLTPKYFTQLRYHNRAKYDYIVSLDDSLFMAYRKYLRECDRLKSCMTDIYYELVENRKLAKFSNLLYEHKVYGCPLCFANSITGTIFSSTNEGLKFKVFLKFKEVEKLWKSSKI